MKPYYTDDWLTLYGGDCREVLASLPADSVDCVVTSPPYWGLRDYGTATWEGGDAECDHVERTAEQIGRANTLGPRGKLPNDNAAFVSRSKQYASECRRCGATRIDSQLGLERTPEEYVANMVAVFAEVRRVLKPSGTCWLNLGDSFYSSTATQGRNEDKAMGNLSRVGPDNIIGKMGSTTYRRESSGLKPKDLVGIPWRVAFALQADGWYLRSDIIWAKPNPMPESVTDRPTKSHEYLFLLTKSARYYFDNEAVREPEKPWNAGWVRAPKMGAERINGAGKAGTTEKQYDTIKGANIRSVWNIATRPYPGAHFAVFPPELPERCIKAGSSEKGVCPECGAPWERVVERERLDSRPGISVKARELYGGNAATTGRGGDWSSTTTGWRPGCFCSSHVPEHEPAVILDPFGGSGTVGMVANRLSRRAILIDLNPEYLKQQMKRNAQTPLGLTEGVA